METYLKISLRVAKSDLSLTHKPLQNILWASFKLVYPKSAKTKKQKQKNKNKKKKTNEITLEKK